MYVTPAKTYRDVIKEEKLKHSSLTTDETQLLILDHMMKTLDEFADIPYIVYDRCPWDNLAYTLYGNSKGTISDEVTAATISFTRESMKKLDMIFYLRYDENVRIVDDGLRDVDASFLKDTRQIFEDLFDQYMDNMDMDIFYPKDDCPAIITVEGSTVDDRLMFLGEFLDKNGDLIDDEGSSILSPDNLELMEQMMKEQLFQTEEDKRMLKLIDSIKKNS
jgi:hypothetical protein